MVEELKTTHNGPEALSTSADTAINIGIEPLKDHELAQQLGMAENNGEKKISKKVVELEEGLAEPAPPPYSAPVTTVAPKKEEKERPFWKKRWFLLLAIGALIVIVVVVATALGVVLSRHHSGSSGSSNNPAPDVSSTSSPTSSSRPPLPSSTDTSGSGDAFPPILNTGLAAVQILGTNPSTNQQTSSVKILFQDSALYLSEKSSLSTATSWNTKNSGNRILSAMNGTPIAAVSAPDNVMPIYVFFINADGYLADVFQDTYGGSWSNGTLADRHFQPGEIDLGKRAKTLSASWCSGVSLTVFVEGDDLEIHAFQMIRTRTSSGSITSTWTALSGRFGGTKQVSSADNIASVCWFNGLGIPPVFVNSYTGIESTGRLDVWHDNASTPVALPSSVASLYRPNTPINAVFGDLASSASSYNYTLLLFFPLPTTLTSISPNPSIHMIAAYPYPPGTLNWSNATDANTGITPYALGAKALYGNAKSAESVDEGVDGSMPRAWFPLLLKGQQGRTVILIYQNGDGRGIKVAIVVGGDGKGGSSDVIIAA
ncbi:hypothetical protein BGZ60DRAFT_526482 [Tricladium varicosporioides]|nr:hypothetical protein BGZ60DRAFT_526482 [Hymenoscyphus varicosporioides]